VKKLLKSVSIYGSYRKIKTGVPFFLEHPVGLRVSYGANLHEDRPIALATKL